MNRELLNKLKKLDDIFDFEDVVVEYAESEDNKILAEILEFISENPGQKDILGHSLQSLTQQNVIHVSSIELILGYEIDKWQLGVALNNLSRATMKKDKTLKKNAHSIIESILKRDPDLACDLKIFHKCCFSGDEKVVSIFLGNGADKIINEIFDDNTALLEVLKSKDIKKVETLVENGADVNLKKENVKKPLDYAMENGTEKIAEYLKLKGAEPSSDDELTLTEMVLNDRYDLLEKTVKEGKSKDIPHALTFAVNRKKVKSAEVILKDENYEFEPLNLSEALYFACQDLKGDDRVKIAKMLIERGADIKAEIFHAPLLDKIKECSDVMDLLKNSTLLKELEDSEERIEEASEELCEFLLSSINNETKKALRINLEPLNDKNSSEFEPWSSCLGGKPYFTKGMEYPLLKSGDPMPFFGQINFGEVEKGLFENQPEKGLLQIFVDEVYSREERFIFIDDILKDRKKQIDPPGFKPLLKNRYGFEFDNCLTSTNPFPRDKRYFELYKKISRIVLGDFNDDQLNKIEEKVYEVIMDQGNNSGHHMGGFVYFTQDDPRYGDKKDYINLIQIDELDGDGDSFFWGDSGLGHIFINPDAFKTLDFSDSIFHFDCY